jgi:4-amino-4-deoxy-L-arabinose transferase-like glycosyltransferase
LFGVALFLAAYHLSHDWYDTARLDSLFLLLTIGGASAMRFARTAAGAVIAGVAFAAAFFTKQAVLFVVIPLLVLWAFAERRRVLVASSTAVLLVATGLAGMHLATDGWSTFFLFEVPRHAAMRWDQIARLLTADVVVPFSLAWLSSIGLIAKTWKSERGLALFYCGLLCGTLLVGLVGRANVAGSPNVFMPAYAALAVTMPLGLQLTLKAWSEREGLRFASIAVHLAALVQLAILSYDPREAVPSLRDREVSDQILARLRSIDHGILIMDDRHFARLLGKPSMGLDYSLIDVLQNQSSPVTAKLQESIIGALRARQFAGVVDPPDFIREKLDLAAPVVLQSTPADQRNRFTPRLEAYYAIAE